MDIATALAHTRRAGSTNTVAAFMAWVTASTATTIDVVTADGTTFAGIPKPRTYTAPAVNDVVQITRTAGALLCTNVYGNSVPPAPAADADLTTDVPGVGFTPPTADPTVTRTFRPISTGTWRGGTWRTDTINLIQGVLGGTGTNHGAAYYGRALAGTVGAQWTALGGQIRLVRLPGGAAGPQRPTLTLLMATDRSGQEFPHAYNDISLRGPELLIGATALVDLPATWAAALLTGAAGGIGIGLWSEDPPPAHLILAGATAPAALDLALTWTTDPTRTTATHTPTHARPAEGDPDA